MRGLSNPSARSRSQSSALRAEANTRQPRCLSVTADPRGTTRDENRSLAHDCPLDRAFAPVYTSPMSSFTDDPNIGPNEVSEPLRRAIGERYLTYALSTIMHRALPDARDGLKPVHRRILYAMRRLNLTAEGRYLKSAKISGDTMGDFHPHGDQAIYDAMARLAQDFNVRYPLVD